MVAIPLDYKVYDPGDVGINSTSIAVAADSNWLACAGYNQMILEIEYTQSGGSQFLFYLDYKDEDGTIFKVTHEEDSGSGVRTLYDRQYLYVVGSSDNIVVAVPILAHQIRIRDLTGGGTDTASVRVRFAVI